MRWLLAILIAWPLAIFGATGGILGVEIQTNGYSARVWMENLNTNGTFNFGFLNASNMLSGSEKFVLSVQSHGFDDSGSAITVTRTIYGTAIMRFPYGVGGQTEVNYVQDVQPDSSTNCVARISLSDYVYGDDSSVTASIATSWYSLGNGATNCSVTNLSTCIYPKPIANWSWPGRRVASSSTLELRSIGFDWSARSGRPLRLMQYWVTDQHGHSNSLNILNMSCDRSMGDANPVAEYIGNVSISSMTDGDLLRCDFVAYPWVGTNTLDTRDGVNLNPPLYAPQTNACNRAGAYGGAVCVVDATNGVDATGLVISKAAWDGGNHSPAPFKTINGAFPKLSATNNVLYGHNDCGGSMIYLTNGTYAMSGNTSMGTHVPWCTITIHPTITRADVLLSNSGTPTGPLTYANITITNSLTSYWSGTDTWFDQDVIDGTGLGTQYGAYPWKSTRCIWYRNSQGFAANGTTKDAPVTLVRGNTIITNAFAHYPCYVCIGNVALGPQAPNVSAKAVGAVPVYASGGIFAYNTIGSWNSGSEWFKVQGDEVHGFAVVQNVVEKLHAASAKIMGLYNDDISTGCTNLLVWYNTTVGDRVNWNYDWLSGSSTSTPRFLMQLVLNNFDGLGCKTDFTSVGDSNRIGNWAGMFRVGCVGNCNNPWGQAGGYYHFAGINTKDTVNCSTSYVAFVSSAAYDGTNVGPGGGNYRLKTESPLTTFTPGSWLLPFDIEGNARGMLDPAGAYASAIPRKGAGFFSP